MSEFTNGVLFLVRDHEPVITGFQQSGLEHVVRSLNSKWAVALREDGWVSDSSARALEKISLKAPLLFFWSAEDHGWGYRIFHQGDAKARLDVSYDAAFNAAMDLFGERYPDKDPFDDEGTNAEFQVLVQEIAESEEYAQELQKQYEHTHPECFMVFDIDPDILEKLAGVLSVGFTASHALWDQVNEFKHLVGIEEMSWVSYDYEDS